MPSELIRYCRYWKRVLYYHFWGIFYLTNYLVNLVNSCKVYLKEILDYVVRWMFKFSKIYRSYSDLYFGLTLFGIQCHMCNMLHAYFLILFIWIIWPHTLVSVIYKATYHQCGWLLSGLNLQWGKQVTASDNWSISVLVTDKWWSRHRSRFGDFCVKIHLN